MDWRLGRVSQTPEFRSAVELYIVQQYDAGRGDLLAPPSAGRGGSLALSLLASLLSGQRMEEVYANLYAAHTTVHEIPPVLRPYFDDNETYVHTYGCLLSSWVTVCDRGLYLRLGWAYE